jgi:hypothetical protein
MFFWWFITSVREFEGLAVTWLQMLGVISPTLGWSGSFDRKLSCFSLKSSTVVFLISLRCFGSLLKSLGPMTWKLCSLRFCTDLLPLTAGINHSLPLLSLDMLNATVGNHAFQNLPGVDDTGSLRSSLLGV